MTLFLAEKKVASFLECATIMIAKDEGETKMYKETESGIKYFGDIDPKAIVQIENCLSDPRARYASIMGDGHYGYQIPIGGVVGYSNAVSPSGVGYDIACVDGDTEFLSPEGWIKFKDYDGEEVCQYSPENNEGSFTKPLNYIKKKSDESFFHLSSRNMDHMVSGDHKLLLYKPYKNDYFDMVAKDFVKQHDNSTTGCYYKFNTSFKIKINSKLDIKDSFLRVIVMVNADGYIRNKNTGNCVVSVLKDRKKDRARKLLEDAKIKYTESTPESRDGKYTNFYFNSPIKEKSYKILWKCNAEQLSIITEECLYWDGNHKNKCFYTRNKDFADFIQYAFSSNNKRTLIDVSERKGGVDYRVFAYDSTKVSMKTNPKNRRKSKIVRVSPIDGFHYCFTVPTGYLIVRRNGKVIITGNCGNKAVLIDADASDVRKNISKIMDDIFKNISFGVGRINQSSVESPLLDDGDIWSDQPMADLHKLASEQLGTIGSGNHFVDVFSDELDRIWIGIHCGSRGFGHKIATYFLEKANAPQAMDEPPCVLSMDSTLGKDYYRAMKIAGEYAYAGRNWICKEVADILGAKIIEEVHNHHNFCIPSTEKIPTPTGWTTIDKIEKGDIVFSFDKEKGIYKTKVKNKIETGEKIIYSIKTRNREIRCSPEHPILTIEVTEDFHPTRKWHKKRVGKYIWKKAEDLKEKDIVVCSHNYHEENKKNSFGLKKSRLLGAFIGDGWLRKNPFNCGYSVGLAIGNKEEEVTIRYKKLLEEIFPMAKWGNNKKGAFGLSSSNKEVYINLLQWNIGMKSKERMFPNFVFNLNRKEKISFISGYIDADGYVYKKDMNENNGRCKICAASKRLVEDLRELCIGIGLHCTNILTINYKSNFGEHLAYSFFLDAFSSSFLKLWHQTKNKNQRNVKEINLKHDLQKSKIGYLDLPNNFFAQYIKKIEISDHKEKVFDIEIDDVNHNFICEGIVVHNCWEENHFGEDIYVVRKGSTPAFPGQKCFVGGSMGDISVILEGVESEESKGILYSTVHGAGRVMGRMEAKGKIKFDKETNERRVVREPRISREDMNAWLREKNVELRGADVDESPQAYKRLPEVLAHHEGTINIVHTLTPLGVCMAGPDIRDPYKD